MLKDVTPSSWLYQEDLVLVHLHRAMGSNWPRCTAQLLPWLAAVRKRNPVRRVTPQASPEPRQRGEGQGRERGQGQGQEEEHGRGQGQGQGQGQEEEEGRGRGQWQEEEEEEQGRGRGRGRAQGGAEGVAGQGGAEEEVAGGDGAEGEAEEDRRRSLSQKHGPRGVSREGKGLGSARGGGLGPAEDEGAKRAEGEGALAAGRGRVGVMASLRIVKRQLDERWRCVLETEGAVRYQVSVAEMWEGCGKRCGNCCEGASGVDGIAADGQEAAG